MKTAVLVALGGAAGALSRYGIGRWAAASLGTAFPWGTLAVNTAGCLLIGLVLGLSASKHLITKEVQVLLATGFCGGFTTFSSFAIELLAQGRAGSMGKAAFYLGLSVLLGLGSAGLGLWLARLMSPSA